MEHEQAQAPSTMEKCIQLALQGHAQAVECFMLIRDVLHPVIPIAQINLDRKSVV